MPKLPYRLLTVVVTVLLTLIFFLEIIDLAIVVGEFLFEGLELLFEAVEYGLDLTIEHLFHTDKITTQTIVFYVLLFLFSLLGFFLWRKLPKWWRGLCAGWRGFWRRSAEEFREFWRPLTALKKTLWLAGSLSLLYLSSFLLF